MNYKYVTLHIVILLMINLGNSFAQTREEGEENQGVFLGNKYYDQHQYAEAIVEYDKVLQMNPNNKKALYNKANAAYRLDSMGMAQKSLEAALKDNTKQMNKMTYHNLGNSFMKSEQYKEAIEAYKNALRIDPKDEETRYNLAYAMEKLKNQSKQQNKDKQDKQDKEKDKKDKKEDKEDKGNEDNKKEDQKDKEEKKDKDGGEKDKDQKDGQQPQQQPSKLTEKQAENILNALREQEAQLQEKKGDKKPASGQKQEKNW